MPHPITVFTQRGCLFSDEATAWLDSQGIPYTERDIETDPAALAEMEAFETVVTPTIVVSDEVVYGFDADRLRRLLVAPNGNPA